MTEDFAIAHNPEADSRLPYLLRIPLPTGTVVLKARETWPRTAKVYCHRAPEWPADAEIIERVPVRSCVRRGASIDLVLDRGRENRSQFVLTRIRGGREAIFWQSARTTKQARPNVRTPTARAAGLDELVVTVDDRERYAYRFANQRVRTERARLPAGDYAVMLDAAPVAAVERKSLPDLVSSLTNGKLKFAIAELASLPRAAIVVEERYSGVFKVDYVRPSLVADAIAEAQVRWPTVPIIFCETRPLAEEWTYRFLAAALTELGDRQATNDVETTFVPAPELPPRTVPDAAIRAWALGEGLTVSDRGKVPRAVREAYDAAHRS